MKNPGSIFSNPDFLALVKVRGFTFISDQLAEELVEVCPPHKVLLDCGWEVPAIANAVACGAQTINNMVQPHYAKIQANPKLKEEIGEYAMEAHTIAKVLSMMVTRFGEIGVAIGLAIESEVYNNPKP